MPEPKRILVLEDDPLQAEWLSDEVIWRAFPDAQLLYFDSEHSFLKALAEKKIQGWTPQYAIMDLLVRYYSPRDLADLRSPPNFDKIPDPKEAGIRCRKELLTECPEVKSVIVTVLDSQLGDCFVIRKGDEKFAEELVDLLKNPSA